MSELSSADIERLREIYEEEATTAGLTGKWSGFMAVLSEDFVYMPPDHPVMHGKDEARAFLEAFPPVVSASHTLESVTGSTELAVGRISFQATVEQDGQQLSMTGKSLFSATKKDGQWLITAACWNLNAPVGGGS